jgi:hypothetical protein
MVSVIPRKKELIPRHSEFRGRASSEARNGTERKGIRQKKIVLQNSQNNLTKLFVRRGFRGCGWRGAGQLAAFPRSSLAKIPVNFSLFIILLQFSFSLSLASMYNYKYNILYLSCHLWTVLIVLRAGSQTICNPDHCLLRFGLFLLIELYCWDFFHPEQTISNSRANTVKLNIVIFSVFIEKWQ